MKRLSLSKKRCASSSSPSPPATPERMPAEASKRNELQATQLEQASRVLADSMKVHREGPAGPSQDSQLIPPGQPTTSRPQQNGLSKVSKAELEDKLQGLENKIVSVAILKEKRDKFQAMLRGDREIPRELRANRELPGLAPGCRFSARTRLRIEELARQQDKDFLELVLQDLETYILPEAEEDVQEAFKYAKKKIAANIPEGEVNLALTVFEADFLEMRRKQQDLLEKRRPKKRKQEEADEQQQQPGKRQRGGKYSHPKQKWRKPHFPKRH